ncbi:MAG: DUF4912 domain-containing protein [Treponema sp.]|nr:DUF4912 domain-containing protein [Treponema sp.]
MAKQVITRSYLETLSFSDLLVLADDYGIDVPENFNHSFLIAELLDVQEEITKPKDSMTISNSLSTEKWPPVYNTTEIDCLLCNPAWAFVFWSVNDLQVEKILEKCGEISLRICSFKNACDLTPFDSYTIQISYKDMAQYVMLPQGSQYVRFDLVASYEDTSDAIASSPVLFVPKVPSFILNMKVGESLTLPKQMELSGAKELLMEHYKQHRQSFS